MSLEFHDMPLRRCASKAAARRQLIFGVRPEAIVHRSRSSQTAGLPLERDSLRRNGSRS